MLIGTFLAIFFGIISIAFFLAKKIDKKNEKIKREEMAKLC
ncbi:MAG: hypothetical protein RBR98_00165 [Candidatus Moranbacteria bacterium]|jgi:hypothetical protein|nr:hypothetical protein [Candidatus Moranbacteria bacterium]